MENLDLAVAKGDPQAPNLGERCEGRSQQD
jgi:hypothetical protein